MMRLCELAGLTPGSGREVSVEGIDLAVLRGAGGVRVFVNSCPHQGRSLSFAPDEFLFTPAGLLVCPHHGACFDPDTGACTDGPCQGDALRAVPAREENGAVWGDLSDLAPRRTEP